MTLIKFFDLSSNARLSRRNAIDSQCKPRLQLRLALMSYRSMPMPCGRGVLLTGVGRVHLLAAYNGITVLNRAKPDRQIVCHHSGLKTGYDLQLKMFPVSWSLSKQYNRAR